jgi:hypothetical protein
VRKAAIESCTTTDVANALERLLDIRDLGNIYVEDAAGFDVTIASIRKEVRPITRCPEVAPAILIEHLDDARLTSARFKGSVHRWRPIRVTLGYVCLDLLRTMHTFDSASFDESTDNDETWGAGIARGLYFRPDDYVITKSGYKPTLAVLRAKRAWQDELRAGRLRFESSGWAEPQ